MKYTTYPSNHYFSPPFIAKRFNQLVQDYGIENVLKHNKLRTEKEAWIASLFSLGFSLVDRLQHRYWIEVNPEDSTPDVYINRFIPHNKGVDKQVIYLEIFEWERHSKHSLEQAIIYKLERKKYPDDYWLLCFAHSREGEEIDLETTFIRLSKKLNCSNRIWFLTNTSHEQPGSYRLVQLFPDRASTAFSYSEELMKLSDQEDVIQGLGRGTRGFQSMGLKFYPLPTLN